MGYYKIKLRKTDKLFSQYIRRIGKCEICGRSDIKLEAAHYFSRGKEATRFDVRNVKCLCFTCHKRSHEEKDYYKNWLIDKYGQAWLDKLELDSNCYKKRDDALDEIVIKAMIKAEE